MMNEPVNEAAKCPQCREYPTTYILDTGWTTICKACLNTNWEFMIVNAEVLNNAASA